jgi:hypothetical protein
VRVALVRSGEGLHVLLLAHLGLLPLTIEGDLGLALLPLIGALTVFGFRDEAIYVRVDHEHLAARDGCGVQIDVHVAVILLCNLVSQENRCCVLC